VTVLEPALSRIEPIFSPRPWGASSLAPLFPEKSNLAGPLGEAWLTGQECRFANGPFAGRSLGESWPAMPVEWRGTHLKHYGDFPLLVKFIFPDDKLSIQVHPDDAYAAKHEQAAGGRGKTEMWHIVSARPGAELLLGLKPGVTRTHFLDALQENKLEELFVHLAVRAGETYFVPAGTQHAIGPGMILCEVQEYSDLTYRVYDFGRTDASGKSRELHIEKAMEVTNFESTRAGKVSPLALHSPDANVRLLTACRFFATERWDCDRTTAIESDPQHFQLAVILQGSGRLYEDGVSLPYGAGQAWFLPASLPSIYLQPDEPTSLLRVFVPDRDLLRQQLLNQGLDQKVVSQVFRE
jgi:mannose-6-phosphate isomerase